MFHSRPCSSGTSSFMSYNIYNLFQFNHTWQSLPFFICNFWPTSTKRKWAQRSGRVGTAGEKEQGALPEEEQEEEVMEVTGGGPPAGPKRSVTIIDSARASTDQTPTIVSVSGLCGAHGEPRALRRTESGAQRPQCACAAGPSKGARGNMKWSDEFLWNSTQNRTWS